MRTGTLRPSAALARRAAAVMPQGNTRSTVFVAPSPPYAARGAGCEIEDVDGRRVLDLVGNYSALVHGHAHPAVDAAVRSALGDGACFGLPTQAEVALAEALCGRVSALERVRFAGSGTEAVMMALRLARAFTGRPGVLRFEHAYHGSYDGVVARESPGITAAAAAESVVVPFGAADGAVRALRESGDRLACVLIDLMPNRAGLRPAEPAFVDAIAAEARSRGILVVVDEVITFRLATGGLHQSYGLAPDLVVLGKLIGGGFPIGAFGGRADVMALTEPMRADAVAHAGTFTANPISATAGTAALRLLDAPAIARINELGERLRAALGAAGVPVSGRGSLLRLLDLGTAEWWSLYGAGVLVGTNGLVALSTPMDERVVDRATERICTALDSRASTNNNR
jgi:glutamate-1-semialdehyde 2,1-aminomutase